MRSTESVKPSWALSMEMEIMTIRKGLQGGIWHFSHIFYTTVY